MKTIVIKNQNEFDALPMEMDVYTCIEIRSLCGEWIKIKSTPKNSSVVALDSSSVVALDSSSVVARDSSSVVALDSSSVEALDSSSVVARDSSSVEAWGSSSVVARDSSSVEARGSSSVEALDSSSVVALDSSSVVARDSSSVEAWGSSSVVARDSSSVVARDSSSVEARGSSSVEARGSSSVEALDSSSVVAWGSSSVVARDSSSVVAREHTNLRVASGESTLKSLSDQVVVTLDGVSPTMPDTVGEEVTVVRRRALEKKPHDLPSFLAYYGLQKDGEHVTLFKSVHHKTLCDFWSGKIKYEGIVECPDFDPDPHRECGGGLHLSPTRGLALMHNAGKLLRCRVHVNDIVVYPHNIDKVRCRRVEVLGPA